MNKEFKDQILVVVAIVVFGGGFLIFGWNYINGNDLSKSPNFDLSAYDEINFYLPDEEIETDVESDEDSEVIANESEFAYIYFSNAFQGATDEDSEKLIRQFLQDYSSFDELSIEFLPSDFDNLARINYSDGGVETATLQKLEEEFGDLITVE